MSQTIFIEYFLGEFTILNLSEHNLLLYQLAGIQIPYLVEPFRHCYVTILMWYSFNLLKKYFSLKIRPIFL
jgi:hypothetical protein